mgnify:CR=1 FL=1|jgi:hypothetical protein
MNYDWWLDRQLWEYDREREREHQQQLEQQEYELGEMETDEE